VSRRPAAAGLASAVAVLIACAAPLSAAAAAASSGPDIRLTPAEIAALPSGGAGAGTSGVAGIQTTVLFGDPTRPGLYTIELRVPADTRIAAHRHRDDRTAVVVSGTWWFGYGPVADEAAAKPLPPGSFYVEPAGRPHFARTGPEPVVVRISGVGPTDTQPAAPLAP
jgi:quercetin dioxygenase-like cupin family protein